MTSFTIEDSDLAGIKDQVVIVTGASSGIGLATTKRLIQHGAKVYASDVNPLPEDIASQVPFLKTDVVSWAEQLALFKAAKEKYGAIHHVFANAGIGPSVTLLEDDVDENGDLLPPRSKTMDINLTGVMYSVKLAIYYIKQNPEGGSIVMTGSGSSFTRFAPTDYTTSKHAVLGLLRSLHENLHPNLPVRINAIGPSWTETGIVPKAIIAALGQDAIQSPDVVARSVINLMANDHHGEFIYSDRGKFWDIEGGENALHSWGRRHLPSYVSEQGAIEKLKKLAKGITKTKGEEQA